METYVYNFVNIVFSLGLIFNVLLFIPQAIKIYKAKNAKGLSLVTFLGFNIMQIFTAWHGYLIKDYILMLGFIFSFITCAIVTCLIIKYR